MRPVPTASRRSSPPPRNGAAATSATLQVPVSAATLTGFREWAKSEAFPQVGTISFINERIFIDMSPEELETHNKVKTEVGRVIPNLNKEEQLGTFYSDRALVTNERAGLSTEPDAVFVTWVSWQRGRVRLVPREGAAGQFIELQGTPDWALEVVSDGSVRKDTQELRAAYYRAGIPEYWLIDARGEEVVFQILVRGRTGYVAAPRRGGWQTSKVFGRSFRLTRRRIRFGLWEYTLEVRPAARTGS